MATVFSAAPVRPDPVEKLLPVLAIVAAMIAWELWQRTHSPARLLA